MLFARLLVRALRWRAAASFAVFLIAAVAVLAAVIGPIYLAVTDNVVLGARLAQTPHGVRDLSISRTALPVGEPTDLTEQVRRIGELASRTRWYGPTIASEATQLLFTAPTRVRYGGRLAVLDDQCEHLHFTAGACPTGADQTVVSARSAAQAHWRIGDMIATATSTENYPIRLRIVGLYRPVDENGTFWQPWDYFDQRPALYQGQVPTLDTFFVSAQAIQQRLTRITVAVRANVALLPATVVSGDEPAIRAVVRTVQNAAEDASDGQNYKIAANTTLTERFDTIDHELSLTRTLIDLATLQLALLAICVLYAIVSATSTAHGGEVALAKLRGRRSAGILAQGLVEPVVLILLAAPFGALLAWLSVRLVAPHTLGAAATVGFPPAAVLVTVLTALAAVVAASLAARRIVTAPVGALLRRGAESETSRTGLLVADAAALVIAVAGLVQLYYGGVLDKGTPNPLSALAPTLLAVAVAVIGLRLLPLVLRAAILATRESRHLVPFLAIRQIGRRPNTTRMALLVSVALALATLAVTTWSVAGTNRDLRALNQAGAERVLHVDVPSGLDLETAVDRADPSGHDALAAEILPVNSTQLLAIQSRRMPGIAAWRADYAPVSLTSVIHDLNPTLPPALTVRGATVSVGLDVQSLTRGVPLTARLAVNQPNHIQVMVDLGGLRRGRHTYRAELPPGCAMSCRVASLGLSDRPGYDPPFNPAEAQYSPTLQAVLTSIRGDAQATQPAGALAYFSDPSRWRQGGDGGRLELAPVSGGLRITAQPDVGTVTWPGLLPNDLPDHLPAVVAQQTARLYPGPALHDISALGLDASPVPLDAFAVSAVLPRLGRSGVIVDLDLAHRSMVGLEAAGVQHQVWLAPGAPADLAQRLTAQGLTIVGTDTSAAAAAVLDHTGPAYADTVFLLAALAATILALGGAVLAALVTARRRSYELAALEATGVRPRTLRRASMLEQGIVIGLGALFGVASGIGGSAMALPSTPIFIDPAQGPPIEYALPWTLLALLIAGLVVVLVVVCAVMARVIEGRATAARLREAAA